MLVYRYEHKKDKRGPYRATIYKSEGLIERTDLANDLAEAHWGNRETPTTVIDFGWALADNENLFCACPSIEILKDWFWNFNNRLRKAGYKVAVYDVDDGNYHLGKSGRQVLFNRSIAKEITVV